MHEGTGAMINAKLLQLVVNASNDGIVVAEQEGDDNILIYANADSGKTAKDPHAISPLLQLAATRGRLMELLADCVQAGNREFADQAFMVGILSLMPTLLGMAMAALGLNVNFGVILQKGLRPMVGALLCSFVIMGLSLSIVHTFF